MRSLLYKLNQQNNHIDMKKITINGIEYSVKYTLRALFIWEAITGRTFELKSTIDNYLLFYSILLACNPDNVIEWDDFIDALDNDPTIFAQISSIVADNGKIEKLLSQGTTDEEGKKKE